MKKFRTSLTALAAAAVLPLGAVAVATPAAALPNLSSTDAFAELSSALGSSTDDDNDGDNGVVDPADNLPDTFDLQSHRFGRGEWTEESAAGLIGSQALDVTTLEFDIVVAEDGTPVVWHDPTIQADKCVDTEPATEDDPDFPYVGDYVHELNWDQLQTLNCNLPLDAYPDAMHEDENKLLQLRDVFEMTKDDSEVFYNIETKREYDNPEHTATPQEFVDSIVPVVKDYRVTERTMIQSFDWATLPLTREQAPEIPLVMLTSGDFDPNANYVGPVEGVDNYLDAADQLGVQVLSPGYSHYYLDEAGEPDLEAMGAYIDAAHERGYPVVPYTINEASHMEDLIDLGVDGLITDYPTRLVNILDERGIDF